jgi:hypothetical protein
MRRATAIAILIWLPLSAVLADVYRSVDAQGHVQYSDTPTPGAQLVRMNNLHAPIRAASAPASTSSSASSKPPTLVQTGDQIHQQLAQEDAARTVQNQVARTRAEQCQKAKEAYEQSVQARRIYKTGPGGEREFLTDDEADKARVANKLEMDTACKGSP